jgi:uncharacterized protein
MPGVIVHLAIRSILKLIAAILIAGASVEAAQAQIPSDKLRESIKFVKGQAVYDFAKLLDDAEAAKLEEVSHGLRKSKKADLVVVTLPDLAGGEIDDFAVKLFNRGNKKGGEESIGDAKLDNGVLLLIAIKERKARIEVGDGLEGILTDGLAKRILEQELFPKFKKKKYAEGVNAAVSRLATILEKAEKAPPDDGFTGKERFVFGLFLTAFVGVGALLLGGGIGGKKAQLIVFGLLFAGVPFLIGLAMLFPYAPIFHSIVAIPAAILGYMSSRNGGWTHQGGSGGWGAGPTVIPWDWSGMGSGSSFGGGSSSSWSGGGFSSDWGGFGGGSSSGGGASGGW